RTPGGPCGKPPVPCKAPEVPHLGHGMRRLLARYLLPQWRGVTLLGVLSTAGIGLDVLNPQVMRRFVDGALAAQALPSLLNLGALYLGIAITSQLVSVAEAYVAEVAAWTATN